MKARRVALFIGVDEYNDPTIATLKGAVADARALHDFFKDRPGGFEVHLLSNPTAGEVSAEVGRLTAPENLPPGSCFLFYFSGHGIASGSEDAPTNEFICADSSLSLYNDEVTSSYTLKALVAGRRHFDQILIFDACRCPIRAGKSASGTRIGSNSLRMQIRRLEEESWSGPDASAAESYRGSTFSLFSCEQGATSEETDIHEENGGTTRHGIFTWALLKELESAAANCEKLELDDSLRDKIERKMTLLSGGRGKQNPGIRRPERPPEKPPVLLEASIDCSKYIPWLASLENGCGLKGRIAGIIRDELSGKSQGTHHSVVIDIVRHFGNLALGNGGSAPTDAIAARILATLCERQEPEIVEKPVPVPAPQFFPHVGKRLSESDRELVGLFVENALRPSWKSANGPLVQALLDASIESELVSALEGIAYGVMCQFAVQNNVSAMRCGTGYRRNQLQPFADPVLTLDRDSAEFERKAGLWGRDAVETPVCDAFRRVFVACKVFCRS